MTNGMAVDARDDRQCAESLGAALSSNRPALVSLVLYALIAVAVIVADAMNLI